MLGALIGFLAAVWLPQHSGSDVELRGLAVRDAQHAWASGFGGTALRTRDGEHWERVTVAFGEKLDFRDVEWLGGETLVLMSAGEGEASKIFQSSDGGATWHRLHTNPDPKGFYDAIAFWDEKNGIVLGDPVDGRFVVRTTANGGRTWYAPKRLSMPPALSGEGAFAASGTCLFALKGGNDAWFVTGGGGKASRVFHSADRGVTWTAVESPLGATNASSGLFSIAFADAKHGFVTGGDYKQPKFAGLNGARTEDGGATWIPAPVSKTGFFSAVIAVPGAPSDWIAVGLAGTASSHDGGRTWTSLGSQPFNAVAFTDPQTGWAIGPKGTIVRFAKP
ncbi:MAG TPA: glycosyl hydrolase [Thermoanaerobaculia bacterium]|jgi:photosystem II stability/assembly factor-like uncharacterized protein